MGVVKLPTNGRKTLGTEKNMAPRRLPIALLSLLVLGVASCPAYAQTPRQPAATPGGQRIDTGPLIQRFRRAQGNSQQQAAVVQEAVGLGRPAVTALYAEISREIYPAMKGYREDFYRQAVYALHQRAGTANVQEVAALRKTVLGLQDAPEFTAETITRLADPAIQRLREIFLVDRTEIFRRSKPLVSQRQKLESLGLLWQQCGEYLYKLMPADRNKPKEPMDFEKYLQGEEDLAMKMAAPMDPQTIQILLVNTRLAAELEPEEARAILELNLTRNLLGLGPLAIDTKLCAAARDHCQDMRNLDFFAHESPVAGKTLPWDRAKLFGTTAAAENIYHGTHDGRVAIEAWFHSPGHHKNMLGKFARVGVGRSGAHFTVMFGR